MALKHQYKEELKKSIQEDLKVELHSRINKRSGLCADCVRAESCTLSHNSDATIWNCEDYENEEVAPVPAAPKSEIQETKDAVIGDEVVANPGLCPFCIHQDTCSLKNLEGGVWHCEEYE